MNERIQELKDKAWATCEEPEQYMDKVAELIVRECANIAFDEYAATDGADSGESAILKHFGVEE
jgi:hypothetical protein